MAETAVEDEVEDEVDDTEDEATEETTEATADAKPKKPQAKTLAHITVKEQEGVTPRALVVKVHSNVVDEAFLKAMSDLAAPVIRLAQKNNLFTTREDRNVYTLIEVSATKIEPKAPRGAKLNITALLARMRELKAEHGKVKGFEMAASEQGLSEATVAELKEALDIE